MTKRLKRISPHPAAKPSAQLDREITAALSTIVASEKLPEPVATKWKRGVASYRKAIAQLDAGSGDWEAAHKARNRLERIRNEAAAYVPGGYLDPVVEQLDAAIAALKKIATAAEERGSAVRQKSYEAEIKRLREEEREVQRPYEWMRR